MLDFTQAIQSLETSQSVLILPSSPADGDSLGAALAMQKIFHQKGKNLKGGRPQKEYIITLDAAKHIAMASRTQRGKEIRRYFIEIEKKYHNKINHCQISGYKSQLSQKNKKINELEIKLYEMMQEYKALKNTLRYTVEHMDFVEKQTDSKTPKLS